MTKYLLDKESIEKLAIEVFGEDRVWVRDWEQEEEIENPDFDYEEYKKDPNYDVAQYIMDSIPVIEIYVHFPEITITNSRKQSQKINDLFVRFSAKNIHVENGYKCDVSFEGMRTTYSFREMWVRYGHSHLNSTFEFYQFCTGTSFYNTLIYSDLRMNPTEETWLMAFMGLENFVSWESLEGGPYHKIENIRGAEETVSTSALEAELRKILPYIPKHVWNYTDELKLIENHPDLYQVFNTYSTIRKFSQMDTTTMENQLKRWKQEYNFCQMVWKENTDGQKTFPFTVNYEEQNDNPQISKEVVDKYIEIINRQVEQYNKNLSYERAKEKYHPITIAKAGTI